jgi:hypothetical protein
MDGGAWKLRVNIVEAAGRFVARLRHKLGRLVICSYPGDPAMIEILLNPDGTVWQDRLGTIHLAGRPSRSPHGSDFSEWRKRPSSSRLKLTPTYGLHMERSSTITKPSRDSGWPAIFQKKIAAASDTP